MDCKFFFVLICWSFHCSADSADYVSEVYGKSFDWVIDKYTKNLDVFTGEGGGGFCVLEHPDFFYKGFGSGESKFIFQLKDDKPTKTILMDIDRVGGFVINSVGYADYGTHSLIKNSKGKGKVFSQANVSGGVTNNDYPSKIEVFGNSEYPLEQYCSIFMSEGKLLNDKCKSVTLRLTSEQVNDIEMEANLLGWDYIIRTSIYRPLFQDGYMKEYEFYENVDLTVNFKGMTEAVSLLESCKNSFLKNNAKK